MLDPCWPVLEQVAQSVYRCAPASMDRDTRYDELSIRWERLLETWQPDVAPLLPYVCMSMRWYYAKRAARDAKLLVHEHDLDAVECRRTVQTNNLDMPELVCVSGVSEFDSQLLRLYYYNGHTHSELAQWLGYSESQARLLVMRAHMRACALHVLGPALEAMKEALESGEL